MSVDIAVLKESRNRIAVRHGLPPIGTVMVNQYGIEWRVDGHLFVPTLSTIARQGVNSCHLGDLNDLYPVIMPQNLSPRLAAFLAETDRCTSKQIMPLDTMPHLRPKDAPPHSHWIDGLTAPHHILLFLDAAHIHETILAHEIGHIWIDLVDDCEDYRMLADLSDTAKVFQWTSLQSFVLDRKVNEVLREKGFDLRIMAQHIEEALTNLAGALRSGYRPPNAHEASFLAALLATAMLDEETEKACTVWTGPRRSFSASCPMCTNWRAGWLRVCDGTATPIGRASEKPLTNAPPLPSGLQEKSSTPIPRSSRRGRPSVCGTSFRSLSPACR